MQSSMFTQFSSLPFEIRYLVWKCCLPARIVELDDRHCHQSLVNAEADICNSWRLRNYGSSRPLIASVCKEARRVAEEFGSLRPFHNHRDLRDIWFQPKLDTLHLTWTRYRYLDEWARTTEPTLDKFFAEALELDIPISMTGHPLHKLPFERHASNGFVTLPHISTELDYLGGNNNARVICDAVTSTRPLDMVLVCVKLHVPEQRARESGLFGLLGDAPVQTVAFDDRKHLERFYSLFEPSSGTDANAVKELNFALADDFEQQCAEWIERTEWVLLAARWLSEITDGDLECGVAGEVWKPRQTVVRSRWQVFQMTDNVFDEEHWWVQGARQKLPKLLPKVMFRLCPYRCNAREIAKSDDGI